MLTETDILRQAAIVGVEAIAEALGISKGEASKKINGQSRFSMVQFCKLLEVCNIEAKVRGTKRADEDYVRALETVVKHKLSEE